MLLTYCVHLGIHITYREKYHVDKNSENFYDTLLEHSLLPVISIETRISADGKGSLIDQIFLNYKYLNSTKDSFSGNYNTYISLIIN